MNKKNSNRRTYSSLKTELTSAAPKHVWLNCSINHTEHVLYHVDALLSRDCCLAVYCCRVLNAQVSSSTVAGCSQQFIFCKINFSHGRIYWRISASHVKLMAAWLVTLSDNAGRGGGGSFNLFILNTFCCCYCVIFNPLSSALLFRYQKKSFKIHKHVIISGKIGIEHKTRLSCQRKLAKNLWHVVLFNIEVEILIIRSVYSILITIMS